MCTFKEDWFAHPEWWFSSKDTELDALLTKRHASLLLNADGLDWISKVLVYDQLARHVYRNDIAKIQTYLKKALLVLKPVADDLDLIESPIEWCFMMMPYRHTNDSKLIMSVMKKTWARWREHQDNEVYNRFLKALYDRCPTDDQSDFIHTYQPSGGGSVDAICRKHANVIDKGEYNAGIGNHMDVDMIKLHEDKCIWSVSGGKDSMVCGRMFANNIAMAVHINYQNRLSADQEEAFVRDWCSLKGIVLYVRRISEIRRVDCMQAGLREMYESYTRNVRYGTYKTIQCGQCGGNLPVLLGHTKDDFMENIFTNIANKSHYNNLGGMQRICENDGITFSRPLLQLSTEDVRRYALHYGIPYTYTSTPLWSMRGQIRNDVVPVINKWNANFVGGLFDLTNAMKSMSLVYDKHIDMLVKTWRSDGFLSVDIDVVGDITFWKNILSKMLGNVSDKSIKNWMSRLVKGKSQDKMTVVVNKNTTLYVSFEKDTIYIKK